MMGKGIRVVCEKKHNDKALNTQVLVLVGSL